MKLIKDNCIADFAGDIEPLINAGWKVYKPKAPKKEAEQTESNN